jgi:hypothetical protein
MIADPDPNDPFERHWWFWVLLIVIIDVGIAALIISQPNAATQPMDSPFDSSETRQ